MVILQENGGNDLNFDAFDPKFHRSFVEYPKDNITWNQHIRGLFTWNNAQCMAHSLNLTSYEKMKDNAEPVYDMVSQKKMPPGEPWPQEQIEMFRKWKDVLDDDGIFTSNDGPFGSCDDVDNPEINLRGNKEGQILPKTPHTLLGSELFFKCSIGDQNFTQS
ncbi:hypothetical protein C1646_667818 [Rhizophagus diaphanus]|nr:hypothetical protein C1646_667818 [Rhizophagus diaphanus] [Rhizophagus sp. MUCL 43196]